MAAVPTRGVVGAQRIRTYAAGVAGMQDCIFVMQGADDTHVIPATAGAQTLGILAASTINVGDPASVVLPGSEAIVLTGAVVAAPAYLVAGAGGVAVLSSATGDQVGARAVSSATAAGDYACVEVVQFVR